MHEGRGSLGLAVAMALLGLGLPIVGLLLLARHARGLERRARDWAESQGIRVRRLGWIRNASGIPRAFRDELLGDRPAGSGCLLFRLTADGPDGSKRRGYLRLPAFSNRFAPPPRVVWDARPDPTESR